MKNLCKNATDASWIQTFTSGFVHLPLDTRVGADSVPRGTFEKSKGTKLDEGTNFGPSTLRFLR